MRNFTLTVHGMNYLNSTLPTQPIRMVILLILEMDGKSATYMTGMAVTMPFIVPRMLEGFQPVGHNGRGSRFV